MPPVPARDFLAQIWGEQAGVAELTVIDPGGIKSFAFEYPASLDSLIAAAKNHSGKTNVYFGVTVRKPGTKIGHGKRGKAVDAQAATCAWSDIDFKTVDKEKVRALIKSFPVPPSIVVMTGGGVHVYWFFRELVPAADLKTVYEINDALGLYFGGDRQCKDMARVLRIPNTMNVKYDPPVPCEVTLWHPERRYNPSDFDFLPREKVEPEAAAPREEEERSASMSELPADATEKIKKLLAEIWIEGWKHKLAFYVAGVFAHAGLSEASAKDVIRGASDANQGDTEKRLKDVEDTYRNFAESKRVAGAPALEKMIREEFPAVINDRAMKIYDEVLKQVRKHSPKKSGRCNFAIDKIVKFDSRPAIYRVYLRIEGAAINVDVSSTKEFLSFRLFREHAYEQTSQLLVAKQDKWEKMVAPTTVEIRPAPEEASPTGAMNSALEEFLEERTEDADPGLLRACPGYDEGEMYFRTEAFMASMKRVGIVLPPNQVANFLRGMNWTSTMKRFGPKNVRVWRKEIANGNGHKPEPPKPSQLSLPLVEPQKDAGNEAYEF